jgi:hypothetical protein
MWQISVIRFSVENCSLWERKLKHVYNALTAIKSYVVEPVFKNKEILEI